MGRFVSAVVPSPRLYRVHIYGGPGTTGLNGGPGHTLGVGLASGVLGR
jgi:hypothetical protein